MRRRFCLSGARLERGNLTLSDEIDRLAQGSIASSPSGFRAHGSEVESALHTIEAIAETE